jgi:hypothetical protein
VNDLNRQSAIKSRNAVPQEVSGDLETIAAGLSLVLARPWLIAVPLIIDLVTWLGIQISAQPLISSMERVLVEQGGASGPQAAEEIARIGENMRVNDVLGSLIPSIFSGLPNDTLLASLLGVLVPAISQGVDRSNLYSTWSGGFGGDMLPGSAGAVIGWAVLFFIAATFVLAIFKAPIAQAVRGGESDLGRLVRDTLTGWFHILALIGLVIAGLAILFATARAVGRRRLSRDFAGPADIRGLRSQGRGPQDRLHQPHDLGPLQGLRADLGLRLRPHST